MLSKTSLRNFLLLSGLFVGTPTSSQELPFVRGDTNTDQVVDVSDSIKILLHLFLDDSPDLDCLDAADVDDTGELSITDPIVLLSFLFQAGPAPQDPFPGCGPDPTPDDLSCRHSSCPVTPPTASFTRTPESGDLPLEVELDATGSTDPDGTIVAYHWSFGDGEEGSGAITTHTYRQPGDLTVTLTVTDDHGLSDSVSAQLTVTGVALPPDPSEVAPPLDSSVPTSLFTATEFIYAGENPIQTGVAPGTIEARRVAILHGRVRTRAGEPLPAVHITVLGHPEYGETLSRADGEFDLAVNGGSALVVSFEKEGFLPAQRQADVPWRDYRQLQDLVMITVDPEVTCIDLGETEDIQVARAAEVSTDDGDRQATLLFRPGTQAEMVLPDGSVQPLTEIDVRATEYTVGENGYDTMPATLPQASAYTYCVELSVDQALAAGATDVRFSEPTYFYLENFLGFPVGTNVPSGYYERQRGCWVPSENGWVIDVLGETDGRVDLDITGDGEFTQDDTDAYGLIGITDAEREKLATLYDPGQSLWRVPITHFTPWDLNWGFGAPGGAEFPDENTPDGDNPLPEPDFQCASVIEVQNQFLGESIPVVGVPFGLHYRSQRVEGYRPPYELRIPLSDDSLSPLLRAIAVQVHVAGRIANDEDPGDAFEGTIFHKENGDVESLQNLLYTFVWDGLDRYGQKLQGAQLAVVRIGYRYDMAYQNVLDLGASGGGSGGGGPAGGGSSAPFPDISGNRETEEVFLWQNHEVVIGSWKAASTGLGGWTLGVHHTYDPVQRRLYRGDGTLRNAEAMVATMTTVVGDPSIALEDGLWNRGLAISPEGELYVGVVVDHTVRRVDDEGNMSVVAGTVRGFAGDGGPATEARLHDPLDIAFGPDGDYYIADASNRRVRRVDAYGIITTVAGNGTAGSSGDGGAATEAQLRYPSGVAVAADGSLYIADRASHVIRRVDTSGVISTVAGIGTFAGPLGDDGPANEAALWDPTDIDIGPDGSLYIADMSHNRIRRVDTAGEISTVAGTGVGLAANEPWTFDGAPAIEARLTSPHGIAVTSDGTLFIADTGKNQILRVSTTGMIFAHAGRGTPRPELYSGEGGPARVAEIPVPRRVTANREGEVYIGGTGTGHVHRVGHVFPAFDLDEIVLPSEDGTEIYFFDTHGRHLRTLDALTSAEKYVFEYGADGRLAQIVDRRADGAGNITTILHDVDGNPTAIESPFGRVTTLSVNADGYLDSIENPAGETYTMTYFTGDAEGLLETFTNPRNNTSQFEYDVSGRLTRDNMPVCGSFSLTRVPDAERGGGWTVLLSNALGEETAYEVKDLPTGERRLTNLYPSGLSEITLIGTDGTRTTTSSDGQVVGLTQGPDPRWGMLAPVIESLTVSTPGGKQLEASSVRDVTLTDPDDALSIESYTETVTTNGKTRSSTYQSATRTITTTSAAGRQSQTVLDDRARVVEWGLAGLTSLVGAYNSAGQLESLTRGERSSAYTYDSGGPLVMVEDSLGQVTGYEHDDADRITKITSAGNHEIALTYNTNGAVETIQPPGRPAHAFGYTHTDRLESYSPPDIGPASEATVRTYDLAQRPDLITRPDGLVIDMEHDSSGRLTSAILPDRTIDREYEGLLDPAPGRLSRVSTSDGVILELEHDGMLLTRSTWSGPIAGSVAWDHDNDFRVSAESVNDEPAVSFGYDTDDLLQQAGALSIQRDAQNGLMAGTTIGDVVETYTWDAFGELTGIDVKHNGSSIFLWHIERDDLGRITGRTETVDGQPTTTKDYTYDPDGRLIRVESGATLLGSYVYDGNGNRTSFQGPPGTAAISGSYDDQDRMLSYGDVTCSYSLNGELQSKTAGGETTLYDYDVLGNLLAVDLPDGTQIEYVVDGFSRRIGKRVDGVLVHGLLYRDALNPVAELDALGNIVARFVYGSRPHVPDYMVRGGTTYRIVTDPRGSVRLVVDVATGAIAQRMDYDAFGRVLEDTNPHFQPFGFAGGLYDRETGLVRFGARDYDPESGRWTSKDPILFNGQQSNLYVYCFADPLNFIDIKGTNPLAAVAVGVAVGAAVGGLIVPWGSGGSTSMSGLVAGALAGGLTAYGGALVVAAGGKITATMALGLAAGAGFLGAGAKLWAWNLVGRHLGQPRPKPKDLAQAGLTSFTAVLTGGILNSIGVAAGIGIGKEIAIGATAACKAVSGIHNDSNKIRKSIEDGIGFQ